MIRLAIEMRRLDQLTAYRRNLRRNDHAVKRMMAAIREFGFRIPVLVTSSGEIIDGDLRVKAAAQLGLVEVPVIVCDDWNEAQIGAFRLLVNRSATWADWDRKPLGEEISDLKDLDFDLSLTGFDRREIEELLAGIQHMDAMEEFSQTPSIPVSRSGDLWQCGSHLVLCGDATDQSDVDRLCGSVVPALMNTDPPYGVAYDPVWRQRAGLGEQRQTGTVQNDDRSDWTQAYRLYRGNVIYCWHAALYAAVVADGLESCGFRTLRPDHLGETALCTQPRALPLAA